MNESVVTSDSSSSDSSPSEGEYVVEGDDAAGTPKFDFSGWNPEAPAGLQFLGLLPISDQGYEVKYPQEEHLSKIKVSLDHRRGRQRQRQYPACIQRSAIDEKRLRQAVNNNEVITVRSLLSSGVDPCCVDDKQRSALHFAASKGNPETVGVLLEHGANPNQKDTIGNTPLHLAACTTHIRVITLLLRAGTDVHSLDHSGRTPLHLARSRLARLQESSHYTSEQLKVEVAQVIDMMKIYLSLSGQKAEAGELDGITHRLTNTSTRQEVDEISQLLHNFTNLRLERAEKQPE